MVAVGLLAAQRGGRALWALPVAFVAAMAFGGVLGMSGVTVPGVELMIVGSVVALGGLVALAARFPLAAASVAVAGFALFHGHAHGTEAPLAASGLFYGLGFLASTAVLHAAGIAAVRLARAGAATRNPVWVRTAGAAISFAGLALWLVV
ncbi:MAG TPA: HupE/UreJ family protein [Longimicrobiales bacterium]|nr:HupE/UreJ family protein [Longimicrobiales bacterium]